MDTVTISWTRQKKPKKTRFLQRGGFFYFGGVFLVEDALPQNEKKRRNNVF
jgi:hypothetical protein